MTLTTSASKEIYCRNWLGGLNLLVDLVTLTKSASQQYQQAEMVEESAGRFSDCHYICQLGNLQQEIGWGGKSAVSISNCLPICQSGYLLAESGWCGKSAERLSDSHQICQSGNLLADIGWVG